MKGFFFLTRRTHRRHRPTVKGKKGQKSQKSQKSQKGQKGQKGQKRQKGKGYRTKKAVRRVRGKKCGCAMYGGAMDARETVKEVEGIAVGPDTVVASPDGVRSLQEYEAHRLRGEGEDM